MRILLTPSLPVETTRNLVRALARRVRGRPPPVSRDEWYRTRWAQAAAELGWRCEDVGPGQRVSRGELSLGVRGAATDVDPPSVYAAAGDKLHVTRVLTASDLDVEPIRVFGWRDVVGAWRVARESDRSTVVKPARDTGGGAGVTVRPTGRRRLARALFEAVSYGGGIALQRWRPGPVVRVLVLDGEVLDAVERRPATVVGDGRSTIRRLVRRENERRASLGPCSTGWIPTGADHLSSLDRMGWRRGSVPASGVEVPVSACSNTGDADASRRVVLDGRSSEFARRAAIGVGVRLAGVDLVIRPDDEPLVLEVNTSPGLHWHVLVAGEPFDPFTAILTRLARRGDGVRPDVSGDGARSRSDAGPAAEPS